MDYVVTAELEPPIESTGLDALQREGVAVLLDRQLARVEGVTGPDESDIDVLDYRITVHPDGASVVLALDAPSLQSAEHAAATVLDELLEETELLAGWTVADSAVRITEDEFNQSLAAAEEPAQRSEAESELEAAIEEALGSSEEEPALETEHWRSKLLELAERVRAFGSEVFTPSERAGEPSDQARLAAGALIHAVRVVTDELFYDELSLAVNNATVDEAVGLLVLEELPPCYEHRYDSLFARSLVLSSAAVATRISESSWTPPQSVAEALALRLFINEARVLLEASELMEWDESQPLFDAFGARAFGDSAPDELFEVDFPIPSGEHDTDQEMRAKEVEAELRARGLAFDQWFETRGQRGSHPYLN